MVPKNYNKIKLEQVTLHGSNRKKYTGKYTELRVNRKTIPKGLFAYECRHADNGDWCTPVTIEPKVVVNFAGTFITDSEITFPNLSDDFPCISLRHRSPITYERNDCHA